MARSCRQHYHIQQVSNENGFDSEYFVTDYEVGKEELVESVRKNNWQTSLLDLPGNPPHILTYRFAAYLGFPVLTPAPIGAKRFFAIVVSNYLNSHKIGMIFKQDIVGKYIEVLSLQPRECIKMTITVMGPYIDQIVGEFAPEFVGDLF